MDAQEVADAVRARIVDGATPKRAISEVSALIDMHWVTVRMCLEDIYPEYADRRD